MKSAQSTQESEWYTQNNWHIQWCWTDCNIAITLHIRLEHRLYFKKMHASDSTTNRASFNFHTGSLNPSKVDQLLNDLVLMHVRHESTAEWVWTPTRPVGQLLISHNSLCLLQICTQIPTATVFRDPFNCWVAHNIFSHTKSIISSSIRKIHSFPS